MDYFPDIAVLPSFRRSRIHQTLVEESFGRSQKMALYPVGGKRAYQIDLTPLDIDARGPVNDFLMDQQGQFGTFYYFDPVPKKYTDFLVATGDGVDSSFPIPFKSGATVSNVKVDGVLKTIVTEWNVVPGADVDELEFTGFAPGDGDTVTANITGRERVIVRLASDTENESFLDTEGPHSIQSLTLIEEL